MNRATPCGRALTGHVATPLSNTSTRKRDEAKVSSQLVALYPTKAEATILRGDGGSVRQPANLLLSDFRII